jgi:UDP-GlcNAc:undecaprenyl-phosphate GlcNAc-1-phosphate transferase
LSTLVGGALTPMVRDAARRLGVLDHGLTARKIHGRPIPRLGGIAIVVAFYAPLLALLFVNSDVGRRFYDNRQEAFALIAGGLAIAALGVFDDLRGADARTKLSVQFAVAGFMYWMGYRIDVIANPFGTAVPLGWLGLPFTVLWIAGIVNAINLIDGLDGLAGGVALIAIVTTFVIAAVNAEPLMTLFTAALGGAVLGFLFYNFNPASIFMGDTGSMFLGFVLATTSIETHHKSSTAVAVLVPIIVMGVPIADTLLAMMRRAARGVPMFSADRGHIHHRLLASGLTQRQAVLVIYAVSIVLGTIAVVLSFSSSALTGGILVALSGGTYFALRRLGFISIGKVQQVLQDRRKNLDVRRGIRRIGDSLREASHVADVLLALRSAARTLDAAAFALHVPHGRVGEAAVHSEGFDKGDTDLFRARFGLVPERLGDTHVELGWADGRTTVERDTEIAIELLCDHLSAALERIDRLAPPLPVAEPAEPEPDTVMNLRR